MGKLMHSLFLRCLRRVFDLQSQPVRNHSYKLAVCGLASVVVDCIAEVRVQHVDIASVPGDFNGVAYGALNAA